MELTGRMESGVPDEKITIYGDTDCFDSKGDRCGHIKTVDSQKKDNDTRIPHTALYRDPRDIAHADLRA